MVDVYLCASENSSNHVNSMSDLLRQNAGIAFMLYRFSIPIAIKAAEE